MKKILVINAGASSIKYSIFNDSKKIFTGKYEKLKKDQDYKNSFENLFNKITTLSKIDLVIHRIVHGGEIKSPVKINSLIKNQIKKFSELAPLHNPIQLKIINLAEKFHKPQYAVFDNNFYSDLPEISRNYPLPKNLSKKYKIKKYGFHGISHKSVSQDLNGKTISCHIGDGVSITAIKHKKPIDTTMGFTPLEGIMMATRSGSIDPGIIFFLQKRGLNVEKILTQESGLKGISGYYDFIELEKNLNKKECRLAYNIFIYQITKQIGAYSAALNGLDNLIFTGAIGINHADLREEICKTLKFLGIELNKNKNYKNNEKISSDNSKVNVFVKDPDEDLEMVKEVLKLR